VIILIKAFSQFKIFWWDSQNLYMIILGIEKLDNFAVSEVVLLLIILMHRNILRMFGLWTTSSWASKLEDGNYELESADEKTTKLIAHNLEHGCHEESVDDESIEDSSSEPDSEDFEEKTLYKHELLQTVDDKSEKPFEEIRPIYKKRTEIIHTKEEVFENNDGVVVIKLLQDDVKLRLQSIDTTFEKVYSAEEIVEVETVIEEPFEFFPSAIFMSFKQYFYFIDKFFSLMNHKRTVARKPIDLYKYMFFCDFVNFFVILFGFSEFAVGFVKVSMLVLTNFLIRRN
jgi:hypothetical protein